jgi:Ca-activated chloride channel family protein
MWFTSRAVAVIAITVQATFSVRTEMVVLPVTVTDDRGKHVAGLTASDFKVFDEGRLIPISTFQRGEIPITIGLVVDHSQSMSSKLAAVTSAASAFARLANKDDEFFIVMFSDEVRRPAFGDGEPFTSDPVALDAALTARIPSGRSAIYDGVTEGLRHLPAGTSPRKALILVTDGGDNASAMKYRDVRDLARKSQAVIYGIGLLGADSQEENPELLKRLCRETGGTAYFPGPTETVKDVFAEIARDLHEQYTLSIPTGAAIPGRLTHSISVTAIGADGKKLKVRTRSGYDVKAAK